MKTSNTQKAILVIVTIPQIIFLLLSLRGQIGIPAESAISTDRWEMNGPFELSPERGRFALTYSVMENHSLYFSLPLAKFALPDLGYKNGHYVSLFAPGVSFLVIPGYIIGKLLGATQIGTFAVVALFGFLNALLIRSVALKLRAHPIAAALAGLTFLFATPAYAYAVDLYQHQISTFLILGSLYLSLLPTNLLTLTSIWLLVAASIPVDYPNLVLMLPIAALALIRTFPFSSLKDRLEIRIDFFKILAIGGVLLPLVFFLWFNARSYGNPFQLSGTVEGVRSIGESGQPVNPEGNSSSTIVQPTSADAQNRSAVAFFNSRNLLNGLYVHLVSPDRGIIYYTPVVLLGVFGVYFLYRKNGIMTAVLVGIVGLNIVLYSLWGDPWGGWAFGSRYLIPSYAILSVFLALALTRLRRRNFFLLAFLILLVYSVFVNTLGALTTSANPPEGEAKALEKISGRQEMFSYDRNIQFLLSGRSKSFIFNEYASSQLQAWQYDLLVSSIIVVFLTSLLVALRLSKEGAETI